MEAGQLRQQESLLLRRGYARHRQLRREVSTGEKGPMMAILLAMVRRQIGCVVPIDSLSFAQMD